MSEKFIQLNQFTQGENRVWFDAEQGDIDFGYSDGQEIEQRLREILSAAEDLSYLSYELKSHIVDWPTEYHLSPVRSNLIRALNFKGVKRVLELGCGCGSITRYLGDFEHADGSKLEVDSVEGSPVRAELAALRCRDLDNINVSTANFNDIVFPEDYYDLVLYVGVTEYAGRFSNRDSDEEALQDLLTLAKKTSTNDGVVMVAIENRTGFKYVEGANEDHYAKPYIGVHNYAQPAGIRTYTKKEWQEQLQIAGFSAMEFIYPFPDYKVPTIFLGEEYVDQNPFCYNHLEGCRSRDYIKDFHYASREVLFWESTAASKTMGDYANSFMMLMSESEESIAQMSPNDFLHLPSYQRKLEYCMSIAKPKGEDRIVRDYIVDRPEQRQEIAPEIEHQRIENEPFIAGPMLSVEWSRSLISYPDLTIFENFLREYYSFLNERESAGTLTIDLLPNNIIVAADKQYHVVDEEWQVSGSLCADYVYFRAILFFYTSYPDFVEEKAVPERYRQTFTLEDWLKYGFQVIGKALLLDDLLEFANANEQFQNAISNELFAIDFDSLLDKSTPLMSLQWKTSADGDFCEENSLSVPAKGRYAREKVSFTLPSHVRSFESVQFFHCGLGVVHYGSFFRIYKVSLIAVPAVKSYSENQQLTARTLFELDNEQQIAECANLKGMFFRQGNLGEGYYSEDFSPSLTWSMDALVKAQNSLQIDEVLQVVIEARFPINGVTQTLLERSKRLIPLESKVAELDRKLTLINNSQSYALALKISVLVQRLRSIKEALLIKKKALINFSSKPNNHVSIKRWCKESVTIPKPIPKVSIIVPFRDEPELLENCIRSIVAKTHYDNYEIIAVSNDSVLATTQSLREQIIEEFSQCQFVDHNIEFNFSALVNKGVVESNGEYIVLLNNDVELVSDDWLQQMLSKALLENVAIVGGRLNFADDTIQHLGLHIADNQLPEHTFKHRRPFEFGLGKYLRKPRYVSAVTGAMFMCSRQIWDDLSGFDESIFGVAFNDVDFCLRAIQQGYQNVLNPLAIGMHHESASRGYETTVNKMRRFSKEQTAFIKRHKDYVKQDDPYFINVG